MIEKNGKDLDSPTPSNIDEKLEQIGNENSDPIKEKKERKPYTKRVSKLNLESEEKEKLIESTSNSLLIPISLLCEKIEKPLSESEKSLLKKSLNPVIDKYIDKIGGNVPEISLLTVFSLIAIPRINSYLKEKKKQGEYGK